VSDEYFTMSTSWVPMEPIDRGPLLEGISDDLEDGLNAALDGVESLRKADSSLWLVLDGMKEKYEEMPDRIAAMYREFSQADLKRGDGLQSLIDRYESVWKVLRQDSKTKLDQAEKRLEFWRGEAANNAKAYIGELAEAYDLVESHITVLESDVVAAREAIASAREDLSELGRSFKQVGEDYERDQAEQARSAHSKVLAAVFSGAVTGLLAASAIPSGGATAGLLVLARGATFAANVAGSAITSSIQREIRGKNGLELFDSFKESVEKIRTQMEDAADDLVGDIDAHAKDLPKVPPPPDVSPGDHFDPDDFETSHTSRETEQNVREADVDIAPDGKRKSRVSAGLDG